ncbi:MAG: Lrp/AsnC family transcriptional regulator [Panacagrimonas sp.]|jgi:DNA-binding Lrp family transcriptional regulator|nr:Lrp/AsnC family transcriptional regulator [Panacagrimonas sp.]MCC2658374.1 Lrp/AsnC family transcriptional regulator [Panacagrimonas sp.]
MSIDLDKYDMSILRTLGRDGRISWRRLADEIGLSLTPTLRRVQRLEKDGFIQGYSANLDEKRLMGAMSAFVSVTLERQVEKMLAGFEDRVAALPEVMSCFQMSGGADYTLRVVVRDLDHYQQLLSRLTRIPGVANIQSSFALKSVIRRNSPQL